jgi:dienelactone hydrolase
VADPALERGSARRAEERARVRRRRATRTRWVGLLSLLTAAAVVAAVIGLTAGGPSQTRARLGRGSRPAVSGGAHDARPAVTPAPQTAGPPYPVGFRVVHIVDPTRRVRGADGVSAPRTLVTAVRYPARGPAGATGLLGAPAARAGQPFPLIVFGHGFSVTPAIYARLLDAWARAGYVVAAPIFPLENAHAPGGPDEADLVNQPRDMSLVISRLLSATRSSGTAFGGLIDPGRVAAAGQSDGGDTALAAAYDPRFRDPRIGAAVILSGAEIPMLSAYGFRAGGPPLLATQGTADTVNPPSATYSFFARAPRPKYLLSLLGASHLPPYTQQQPQLSIVEGVSIAFLDHYLKRSASLGRMRAAGRVAGVAALQADG